MGFVRKPTALSHSRTEAELVSLDAGSLMEGLPAMNFRVTVVEVLQAQAGSTSARAQSLHKRKLDTTHESLGNIHHVSPNARLFRMRSSLHVVEDNEAVIKMITKESRSNDETRFKDTQAT